MSYQESYASGGGGGGGSGDVNGPANATDNAIARFNGASGKAIQNSGATIDDSGNLTANNVSGTNTGDQTITLTGDVTGSGTGSFAATIASDAVTYDKIQDTTGTDVILGRETAGAGTVEEIACTAAGRALLDDANAAAQRTTIGLGNVDNTSDANKPVSTATQTALDLKANLASPIFTGVVKGVEEAFILAISDENSALTTGTAKLTFRMPYAFTVTEVRASLTSASTSGVPTFDINENGTSILSTKITIDVSEKTSTTAATAPVISDSSLADDAEMTLDIDVAGTNATGAKITIIGKRA